LTALQTDHANYSRSATLGSNNLTIRHLHGKETFVGVGSRREAYRRNTARVTLSVLLRLTKVPMMPVMSEDSPRTIKDYYARVTLQRHHIGNSPESDERIEVVVRIPEEVAKTLAGGGKPSVVIFEVGSRVRNMATETVGVPNDSSLVIAVVSTVDAVMPPSLPTESNFTDQDGAEGWIL